MKKIKFLDLPSFYEEKLRENRDDKKSYKSYLYELLNDYVKNIQNISDTDWKLLFGKSHDKTATLLEIRTICTNIKKAYNFYLKGFPQTSEKYIEGLFARKVKKIMIEKRDSLYRARSCDEKHRDYSKGEMFHVPFEKRNLIQNYRFSISGYPCLYLGNSILACWEEMKRPPLANLCISRFNAKREIQVLDLTIPHETKIGLSENKSPQDKQDDNYHQSLTWPLILACSIKTITPKDPFKYEYVIPQVIMQVLKRHENIYGVAYSSTQRDINITNNLKCHMNFALPARKIAEKGYCEELMDIFEYTRGVSFNEIEIKGVANKVKPIKNDPYTETKFGRIEICMNKGIIK